MDKQYYIVEEGHQTGPFTLDELKQRNISPDTLVWCQGMTGWEQAMSVPDFSEFFFRPSATPPQYGPNAGFPSDGGSNPYYGGNTQSYGENLRPDSSYPYGQPHQGRQQYDYRYRQNKPDGHRLPPTNWLPWAIVATVGGCLSCLGLIFGILGIVNANKANSYYAVGEYGLGDSANSTAKTMTIIALVLDGLSLIGSISLFSTGLMPMVFSY